MRRNIFAAVLAWLAITAGSAAGQDSGGVIDNYYKVTGLDRFADSLSGSYYFERLDTQGDQVVESRVHISYPDRYRIEASQMDEKVVMVFNGDRGWVKISGESARELKQDGMEVMKSVYDLFDMLMFRDSCLTFENGGDVQSEGRRCRRVVIEDTTPDSPTPVTCFYFDSETGLLDRAVSKVKFGKREIETVMVFRNYQKIEGFTLPTEIATMMDGREEMVIRTITVKAETQPDDLFDELK